MVTDEQANEFREFCETWTGTLRGIVFDLLADRDELKRMLTDAPTHADLDAAAFEANHLRAEVEEIGSLIMRCLPKPDEVFSSAYDDNPGSRVIYAKETINRLRVEVERLEYELKMTIIRAEHAESDIGGVREEQWYEVENERLNAEVELLRADMLDTAERAAREMLYRVKQVINVPTEDSDLAPVDYTDPVAIAHRAVDFWVGVDHND